jgi:CheY-like chemotaxis protein
VPVHLCLYSSMTASAGAPESTAPILIVDDEVEHRLNCRELLEDEGYAVEEAGDGERALARLIDRTRPQPAVVLLDLSMPIMDGWELLAIMKSYTRLRSIPVVLVSAHEPRLNPVRHGAISAYLHKPYSAADLLRVVAQFAPSGS